jgi:hypothetical protein
LHRAVFDRNSRLLRALDGRKNTKRLVRLWNRKTSETKDMASLPRMTYGTTGCVIDVVS